MDHLFRTTPSHLFATLTVAGIVASASVTLDAGAPLVQAFRAPAGRQVRRVFAALPTPRIGVLSVKTAAEQTVASVQSQVTALASRVTSMEQVVQHDVVLGDATSADQGGTMPVPMREEFPPAVNLLRNSSFEESSDDAPRQWNYQLDSNSGNTKTSAEAYRSGSQGLKVVGGGTGNYGVSQPAAKMIERRDYAFSVWVKPVNTDPHTIKLSFWDEVANKEAAAKTFSFSGTKEWSRIVFQISNKNGWNGKKWFPMIMVNGLGSGSLYLDDAQLEEASSYTPYHFTGGGATQSFVSMLGDGGVEIDAHGNIYPAVNGIGGIGTGDNKFSEIKLSKASIDKDGTLTLNGDLTVNGNSSLKGTYTFTGKIASHLIPDTNNSFDLGSTTSQWRNLYVGIINSISNGNIGISAGTGTLNISAATAQLTGNLVVTGTETLNGVAYTFPGADGSSSNILSTNGSGILSWSTIGASGITADSLDFTEFKDSMALDADTSINGPFSLIVRTGNAARQNATAGNNDLQLSAADQILMDAATFRLATSSGSAGTLDLIATGTMTLSTSSNGTNILARTGTGRFDVAAGGTGTGSTAAITLASTNGGIDLSTSGVAGNGNLTLRSAGNLLLDASASSTNIDVLAGGRTSTSLTLRSFNGGIDVSSSSANGSGDIVVRSAGTLSLDTSKNNANILANTGTGRLIVTTNSTGTGSTAGISLLATSGGIDISTSGVGGNGNLTLRSGGNFVIDTTGNNNSIAVLSGDSTSTSLTLRSTRGGIDVSSGYAAGSGDIIVRSGGSLRLDNSSGGLANAASNNIIVNSGGRGGGTGGSAIQLQANNGAINVSSGNAAGSGDIALRSGGSLILDTSAKGGNVNIFTGTGFIGVNQTAAPNYTLDVSGTGRFVCTNNFANASKATYCSDVAEAYETNDSTLTPGDVLIIDRSDSTKVARSLYAYQGVIGVYSTSPGLLVGGETILGTGKMVAGDNRIPVAMVGRVPVKVNNENGPIKIGDRLVSSSTPGYAMKAIKQGVTLGAALEGATFTAGSSSTVMTYVNISWYFPEVINELERQYALSNALGTTPNAQAALAAAVSTTAPSSVPAAVSGATALDLAHGAVLGTTTSAPELRVAIPPTEFPNLLVAEALTVGQSLTVHGTSRFEGEVTAVADATFEKSVIIIGNLHVGGNLDVAGALTTPMIAGSTLAAGDPVSINGDGTVSRAGGGRPVVGIAASHASSGGTVSVAIAGRVGGLSGLTAGSRYFVSGNGVLTADGAGAQSIGVAVTSSELIVQAGAGLPVAAPSAALGTVSTPTASPTTSESPSVVSTTTAPPSPSPTPAMSVTPTPSFPSPSVSPTPSVTP